MQPPLATNLQAATATTSKQQQGQQGINLLLATSLTDWRIRLREIVRSPAWQALEQARDIGRWVPAQVEARLPRGLAVTLYGLHGLLPTGQVQGVRRGRRDGRRGLAAPHGVNRV